VQGHIRNTADLERQTRNNDITIGSDDWNIIKNDIVVGINNRT